jgi:predicted metal-binding membrane protein
MTLLAARMTRPALAGSVVALGAAAWVVMAALHEGGHHHAASFPAALTGWAVMVVAMMLPAALPLLELVRRFDARLVALAGAVYLSVWTVAGAVLVALHLPLSAGAARLSWTWERPHALLGAGLVVAGAYQFSSLKDRCLTACRSPRGIAMLHWRGLRPPWVEAATVSAVYAASCVGCCWLLMATGLLTGAGSLAAMAVLTAVMAAERLTRWGRLLVRPAGAAAVILGAALLLGAVHV